MQISRVSGGWRKWPHREEDENENEIACSSLAGRKLRVCRTTLLLRTWRGSRLWILCCTPAASSSRGRIRAGAWSRLYMDWWILVPRRSSLELARWILGSAAIRWRLLGRSALLRRPLLRGTLAQVVFRQSVSSCLSAARLGRAFLFPRAASRRCLVTNTRRVPRPHDMGSKKPECSALLLQLDPLE